MTSTLRKQKTWPFAASSTGRERGTLPLGPFGLRLKVFEAIGEARAIFINKLSRAILTHLNDNAGKLQTSGSLVDWSLFMMGRSAEKTKPMVMFVSDDEEARTEAFRLINKSGIIKEFPGFDLGHMELKAEFENLRALGDKRTAGCSISSGSLGDIFPERVDVLTTKTGPIIGRRLEVRHRHGLDETFSHAVAGGVVEIDGVYYFHTISHFLSPPVAAQNIDLASVPNSTSESAQMLGSGWDATGLSDFEDDDDDNDDEVEFVEATSRGSATPESGVSDASSNWDSVDDSTSSSTSVRMIDGDSLSYALNSHLETQLPESNGGRKDDKHPGTTPQPEMVKIGRVALTDTRFDSALVEIDMDLAWNLGITQTQLRDIAVSLSTLLGRKTIEIAPKDTSIRTITSGGRSVTGTLSGTPSFLRLPYSKSFQELYVGKLDQPLAPGDCGSWIHDGTTGKLFGYVIAGSPTTGLIMVMPAATAWGAVDISYLHRQLSIRKKDYERITTTIAVLQGVIGGRAALLEAKTANLRRLTYVAMLYAPLAWVTAMFLIPQFAPSNSSWATAILITALGWVLLACWYNKRWLMGAAKSVLRGLSPGKLEGAKKNNAKGGELTATTTPLGGCTDWAYLYSTCNPHLTSHVTDDSRENPKNDLLWLNNPAPDKTKPKRHNDQLASLAVTSLFLSHISASGILTRTYTSILALVSIVINSGPLALLISCLLGCVVVWCCLIAWLELGLKLPRVGYRADHWNRKSVPHSGGETLYLGHIFNKPRSLLMVLPTLLYATAFLIFGNLSGNSLNFAIRLMGLTRPHMDSGGHNHLVMAYAVGALTVVALGRLFLPMSGIWLNKFLAVFKITMLVGTVTAGFIGISISISSGVGNGCDRDEHDTEHAVGRGFDTWQLGNALVAISFYVNMTACSYTAFRIKQEIAREGVLLDMFPFLRRWTYTGKDSMMGLNRKQPILFGWVTNVTAVLLVARMTGNKPAGYSFHLQLLSFLVEAGLQEAVGFVARLFGVGDVIHYFSRRDGIDVGSYRHGFEGEPHRHDRDVSIDGLNGATGSPVIVSPPSSSNDDHPFADSTVQPKPILKNKNTNRVRFDDDGPREVSVGNEIIRTVDKHQDRDRDRDRSRRDRVRDGDRERDYRPSPYRLYNEQQGQKARNRSDRDRDRERDREQGRGNDKDRGSEQGERSGMKNMSIGGSAASLLSVLTEAAAYL
ncbi:hypothetical protein B0H66DRAFT_596053 [Apodospora peruviana]|uniref:Uncharacterized protein n=1 Tax=Apodospora peruviana TaxID=516989 RepID=A0AAE0HTB2_9PEZI|nr:hypothetical protein B0H66DRAFT_596053 [Apodospora peruviana]